jgi:hypothetical protein
MAVHPLINRTTKPARANSPVASRPVFGGSLLIGKNAAMRRMEELIVNGLEVACAEHATWNGFLDGSGSTTANWPNGLGSWINVGPPTVGRPTKPPV